jgi:hypothetical protein
MKNLDGFQVCTYCMYLYVRRILVQVYRIHVYVYRIHVYVYRIHAYLYRIHVCKLSKNTVPHRKQV